MGRTRVKICGVTRREDAAAAVRLGADALGFNFWRGSSRALETTQAAAVMRTLPPFATKVGLFVDAPPQYVQVVCKALPLDLLQFHGDETPGYCKSFGKPYIKALRGESAEALARDAASYGEAMAILVDGFEGERFGGTGKTFDWSVLPPLPKPLVLAGGLTPGNVAAAIKQAAPYAVDVSTGVEASPGQKDPALMQAFIAAVQAGDAG